MELLTGILSAVIAAIVSLVVALISFIANRNALRSEREKFERELRRGMTDKLYDMRLEAYPEAIAITDRLRRSKILKQGEAFAEDYFQPILSKLDDWHSQKAFLLLSHKAVYTFYTLRKALIAQPALDGRFSKEQVENIWKAKNAFRIALRNDIQLLYEEETESLRED